MMTGNNGRNIILRPYLDRDWGSVRSFIIDQWGSSHPMSDRTLFDWQFCGFGSAQGASARSLLLFLDDELAGFRGIIPGLYQVPSPQGMKVSPGGSLAMWNIRKKYRGRGLGLMMHQAAEAVLPVITGAGSNPQTSVPIYMKNGFQLLPSVHRYMAALDHRACIAVFGEKVSEIPVAPRRNGISPLAPSDISSVEMERIWKGSALKAGFFSLYRNSEFWRWRYIENPGFKYRIFHDPEGSGLLVSRTEQLASSKSLKGKQWSILRMIEIVPANPSTWLGVEDTPFKLFLERCLNWARGTGCIAADFHCSSDVFGPLLLKAGFAREQDLVKVGIRPLPLVFNGMGSHGRPINVLVKAPVQVSFEKTCFVKSDNDMDRPRRLDKNGQVIY
ncbi:MAG: GNAT family N-acetyltransferase [Deltaproteobacteria bacterium]|nr:GNAT family N-acetyltransferase [Deltaproteobacteria bacterium]